jgi:hypothetical protein
MPRSGYIDRAQKQNSRCEMVNSTIKGISLSRTVSAPFFSSEFTLIMMDAARDRAALFSLIRQFSNAQMGPRAMSVKFREK